MEIETLDLQDVRFLSRLLKRNLSLLKLSLTTKQAHTLVAAICFTNLRWICVLRCINTKQPAADAPNCGCRAVGIWSFNSTFAAPKAASAAYNGIVSSYAWPTIHGLKWIWCANRNIQLMWGYARSAISEPPELGVQVRFSTDFTDWQSLFPVHSSYPLRQAPGTDAQLRVCPWNLGFRGCGGSM